VRRVPDHHASRNEARQHGSGPKFAAHSSLEHGRAVTDLAETGEATVAEREHMHPEQGIRTARIAERAAVVGHDHHEVALSDDRANLGLLVLDCWIMGGFMSRPFGARRSAIAHPQTCARRKSGERSSVPVTRAGGALSGWRSGRATPIVTRYQQILITHSAHVKHQVDSPDLLRCVTNSAPFSGSRVIGECVRPNRPPNISHRRVSPRRSRSPRCCERTSS
jgi:hypothetical protein